MAFMTTQGTWSGKSHHIGELSPLPPHKIKSIQSWWTKVVMNRVSFYNFKATTRMGMDFRAFQMNPYASDNIPMQEFYDTTFHNCEESAMAYFMEPPQKWAIIKDCGAWPCSAPKNTMFIFRRTKFVGPRPSFGAEDFQMIPDTPNFSEHIPGCRKQAKMNLWTCENEDLGIL
jgi:hypothetical protein